MSNLELSSPVFCFLHIHWLGSLNWHLLQGEDSDLGRKMLWSMGAAFKTLEIVLIVNTLSIKQTSMGPLLEPMSY